MKFLRKLSAFVLLSTVVSACSSGGGASPAQVSQSTTPGAATGTLIVGTPGANSQARSRSHARRPDYVSSATKYATLWIDNQTPGTRVACTPGSAKSCSINWTSTAGNHVFTIAVDDSSSVSGGGNVLADASANETLTVGSNTLSPIYLYGVPKGFAYISETLYPAGNGNCPNISGVNCYVVNFEVTDADGQLIGGPYPIDGCPVASPSGNGGLSSCADPSENTQMQFDAFCYSETGGSYGLTTGNFSVALPTGTSMFLTAAEIAEYSLLFQSNIGGTDAFPSYTCSNGTITAAGAANGSITAE